MRHLRMVGLCLVAVFAIAAVAATSASALPEWGQCYVQAKHEGKYANSNCTIKAKVVNTKKTGEFEWRKGTEIANKHFGGSGGTGVLTGRYVTCTNVATREPHCAEGETEEVVLGKDIQVECASETNQGEAKGTKEIANVSVVFRKCVIFGSVPCANTPNEGEIQVNLLKGTLGYISKSAKEVGVRLTPNTKHGEFAKFSCGGIITTVVGQGNAKEGAAYSPETTGGNDGIISPIIPVNAMSSSFTQTYTIDEETLENLPRKFEGKPLQELESYIETAESPGSSSKWSKAGETVTNVNTPAEPVEIKG